MTTFATPPLAEVALGIQFDHITAFKVTDYTEIWNLLGRKEFPTVENQPPLITIGTNGAGMTERFGDNMDYPLPRSWFISPDNQLLFQFQTDRFLFNWRRLDETADTYVRYPGVKKEFFAGYKKLAEFFRSTYGLAIKSKEAELTYVNFIPIDSKNIAEQSSRYLLSPSWQPNLHSMLKNPTAMFSKDIFEGRRPDSKLEITCGSAQNTGNGDFGIRIELVARGQIEELEEAEIEKWFDDHHDLIVKGFCDITTKEAHKEWGMEDAK